MGTRTFKNEGISPDLFRERISEMAHSLARESDLADSLARAMEWYLRDQSINHRQACVDALTTWREARSV